MVRVLGRVITALLRSRYGLAALLALLVVGIIGTGRFASHGRVERGTAAAVAPIPIAAPGAGADGVTTPTTAPLPTTRGEAGPQQQASGFATAWLHADRTPQQWRQAMRPYLTEALAAKLAQADPASVPTATVSGEPTVQPMGRLLAQVSVPTDAGRLVLRVIISGDRWRVDAVDWAPA